MLPELIILVNAKNEQIGIMEKIEAHEKGLLHRAFSVFIYNSKGEMLLQKRQLSKYHSAGLWTNACCGHPRPGEVTLKAAKRRLYEEMGINIELEAGETFTYTTHFTNNLTENEVDQIFTGYYNNVPQPNPLEVMDYCWMPVASILNDIRLYPDNYTSWFKIAVKLLH